MMVVNKMAADSVGEAMYVVHWAGLAECKRKNFTISSVM